MSRIGKKPVDVPENVQVTIDGRHVVVESGGARQEMTYQPGVRVEWGENERELRVSIDQSLANDRQTRAMWGTTRSLLHNMVQGVTKGFEKRLEVVGVGWTASVDGQSLELRVGYAAPVNIPIPPGLDVSVNRNVISVKGVDKREVGQFAARVRDVRRPDPYKGKGIKYEDETIRRKAGKVFGS